PRDQCDGTTGTRKRRGHDRRVITRAMREARYVLEHLRSRRLRPKHQCYALRGHDKRALEVPIKIELDLAARWHRDLVVQRLLLDDHERAVRSGQLASAVGATTSDADLVKEDASVRIVDRDEQLARLRLREQRA